MRWRWAVSGAAIWCGTLMPTVAQNATDPSLHHRDASTVANKTPDAAPRVTGQSTLPPDASGEYLLDESGSMVEITIDSGKISGYVTRMGDEQSDKDTPLTFFFDRVTAQGHRLGFTTRKVHGVWYVFDGSIERGDPKTTRDENGYYRLQGAWTTHDDTRNSQSREQVSLKSTPRDSR